MNAHDIHTTKQLANIIGYDVFYRDVPFSVRKFDPSASLCRHFQAGKMLRLPFGMKQRDGERQAQVRNEKEKDGPDRPRAESRPERCVPESNRATTPCRQYPGRRSKVLEHPAFERATVSISLPILPLTLSCISETASLPRLQLLACRKTVRRKGRDAGCDLPLEPSDPLAKKLVHIGRSD